MGSRCACWRPSMGHTISIESSILKKEKLSLEMLVPSQVPRLSIQIPVFSNVNLQSAALGYLSRKRLPLNVKRLFTPFPNFWELFIEETGNFYRELADTVTIKEKPAFVLPDGVAYQGEWNAKGQKHGKGAEINVNGTRYLGQYKYDMKEGFGRLLAPGQEFYEGELRKDKLHGVGLLYRFDGYRYEGTFRKGLKYGYGKEREANGTVYEGMFSEGQRSGVGKVLSKNGDSYQGEFKCGVYDGDGHLQCGNGDQYEGNFSNGAIEGIGGFKYANGRLYRGEYKNNLKHGQGRFQYVDGKVYEGNWLDGAQDGLGCMIFHKNEMIVQRIGIWKRGRRIRWIND